MSDEKDRRIVRLKLIIFRGITMFGAGIIISTFLTAIGDLYLPRERARWTGFMRGILG